MSTTTKSLPVTAASPRRGSGPSQVAVDVGLRSLTCGLDGQTHAISGEQWARGLASGQFLALCGRVVVAASLLDPVGPRCLSCEAVRLEQSPVAPAASEGDRRSAWRRRNRWLVSRCQQTLAGGAW